MFQGSSRAWLATAGAVAALCVGQAATWAADDGASPVMRAAARRPLMMMQQTSATTEPSAGRSETPQVAPTTTPTSPDQAETTPASTPLMRLLGAPNGGVGKALSDAGISITGYVEGGYTYNFSSPTGNASATMAFNQRHDSPELDQVEILVQRSADYTKPIDAGFYLENIYGTDTAFFHANGLTLVSNGDVAGPFAGTGTLRTVHPRAQYDPTQAYFTVASNALAKGVGFQGGKFATLLGYELIAPYTPGAPAFINPFYSHSLMFTQEPYTQTGALGIIKLDDDTTFTGGVTRGYDQATEDNNGDLDFMGQLKYNGVKDLAFTITGLTGREQPSAAPGTVGLNGWRTTFDTVVDYKVGDKLDLVANGFYNWEAQTGNAGFKGGVGQWYGVAAYARYTFSDFLQFNFRGEWFNDPDAAAPTQYSLTRRPNQYYELTLGTIIHPFPQTDLLNNFFIRPEARFDYADKASFDPVGAAATPSDHYFFTFSVDGVYAF